MNIQNEPLVSVLITAYNREKYIEEAIYSVLESSYQNFELIIVDDQSTDTTFNICLSLKKRDKRIKVFQNDKNLGDYPNRNIAASYAIGKYIKYLDADDILYKHSLAYMVDYMERNDTAVLGISSSVIDPISPYPYMMNSHEVMKKEFLSSGLLSSGPSASIIKRNAFEAVKGFSGRQFVGDHELWLKLAANNPILIMQPSLIWWRQHPDQQIVQENRNLTILNVRYKLSLNALKENKFFFSETEYIYALARLKRNHARNIIRTTFKERSFKTGYSLWKNSNLNFFELLTGFLGYKK